jgi:hypothetical protein
LIFKKKRPLFIVVGNKRATKHPFLLELGGFSSANVHFIYLLSWFGKNNVFSRHKKSPHLGNLPDVLKRGKNSFICLCYTFVCFYFYFCRVKKHLQCISQ